MTAAEVYELTVRGGATDFARVIAACQECGPWSLAGDLAVNVFAEPVYTVDADFVVVATSLQEVSERLEAQGFVIEQHAHSVNAHRPGNDLRIQFTTDVRYQDFLARSVEALVLGMPVRVACLVDTTQGKLWAYSDPTRRFSKRKKDELDLIRLAEAWPQVRAMYPSELLEQIDRG